MKLLESTKSNITKDENSEIVPRLDITEVLLVHCNIVNNHYQHDSRVLYTFVPNELFGQLLDISSKNLAFFKKRLILSFHILNYGLLFKILNC